MVDADSNTAGFAFHRSDRFVKLLLPLSTIAEIGAQSERLEMAAAAETAVLVAAERARKEAPKPKPVYPPTKSIRPGPRNIEIFSEAAIETLLDNFDAMDGTTQRAGAKVHSSLTTVRGRYRTVPAIDRSNVLSLAAQFENMAEPIAHLVREIDLMAHLPPADFQLTPILLLGAPGIGKTAFAGALATALGPYSKLKGTEPAFCLNGSHATWSRAAPGLLMQQMSLHDSAAPLFLVDEMDKQSGEKYPIENVLLDLLEPENARHFKDEFFQIEFDVSHAVWILTANTIAGVSAPLLSRMTVFDIPAPGVTQRRRIIESDFETLCTRTGVKAQTTPPDVTLLAKRVDLDLRQVSRIVRDSFIAALQHKDHMAQFDLPPAVKPSMGFR
ncbi:MAG: AAA family ATPase [Cypionkella sp.]